MEKKTKNILSSLEYQSETNAYQLSNKIVNLNVIPKNLFVKSAIYSAKKVQHLIRQQDVAVCSAAIDMAEKYLRGFATQEQCCQASDAACTATNAAYTVYAANAAVNAATYAACTAAYAVASAAYAVASAAYAVASAANATNAVAYAVYAANAAVNAINVSIVLQQREKETDFFRASLPWSIICAAQIFATTRNQQFPIGNEHINQIEELAKNQELIEFGTIMLGTIEDYENFQYICNLFLKKFI